MSYRGYLGWALIHHPAWGLRLLWVEIHDAIELWWFCLSIKWGRQ